MNGNEIYKIVTPHVVRFYKEFRWLIPDFVDMEDFIQEAALGYFNNQNRPVRFVCLDYLLSLLPSDENSKHVLSHLNIDDPEIKSELEEPSNFCVLAELINQFKKIECETEQKSKKYRYILYSKFIEGKSLSEIGEDLGFAKSTIHEHLHNCLNKLKELNEKMS